MKPKYVAYYRVSTDKQGESGLGLEAQQTIIRYFANGEENIIAWYEEVHSGKDLNDLPQLQKAKEHAKQAGAILILAKTDRLRNTQQALDLVDEMTSRGVVFCDVPNADKFTLTLFFALAERERLITAIRTKAALAEKKKQGIKLGNPNNFNNEGRRKGGEVMRRRSVGNTEIQKTTAQAISFRKEGFTLEEIAGKLNMLNYRTPKGSSWRANSVHRILNKT